MNTTPQDGGPAFPFELMDWQPATGIQVVREQFQGMTLRDYFAAKAMQGSLAGQSVKVEYYSGDVLWEAVARDAYRAADAMLAERKKGQP